MEIMESKKESVNVSMDGSQYIEFLKYKDNNFRKGMKPLVKFLSGSFIWFASAFVISVSYMFFTQQPEASVSHGYVSFYGITVSNTLISFGLLSIFMAWIIHGFGFIIVRR